MARRDVYKDVINIFVADANVSAEVLDKAREAVRSASGPGMQFPKTADIGRELQQNEEVQVDGKVFKKFSFEKEPVNPGDVKFEGYGYFIEANGKRYEFHSNNLDNEALEDLIREVVLK